MFELSKTFQLFKSLLNQVPVYILNKDFLFVYLSVFVCHFAIYVK